MPASLTRGASAPPIFGKAASVPSSWTRSILGQRCATCRTTSCAHGRSGAHRIGAGPSTRAQLRGRDDHGACANRDRFPRFGAVIPPYFFTQRLKSILLV